ncbi:MAG: glycosyltransferase [Bacteroidota bacterium]
MIFIVAVVCLILLIVVLTDLLLLLSWFFRYKRFPMEETYQPFISILVAARNEENTIALCLQSLIDLNYPKDKYEILVGNDQSTDATASILKEWQSKHGKIKVYHIDEQLGSAKGKANVLAHLTKEARGEFFFMTDADCTVNPSWLKALLGAYKNKVGIVVGITDVNSVWQGMDWLFALGMIKALHDLNNPVVAMGNNMFVTRQAYEAIGGYESIPFSVTEDLELFRQVKKKGYQTRHVASAESTVLTQGISGLMNLLSQRKRWLTGAIQLHPAIVFLLLMQALYYPALTGLFFIEWPLAILIFVLKALLQALIVNKVAQTIRRPKKVGHMVLFEFYQSYVALVSSVYFLLPSPVRWKGRKY